MKVQCMKEHRMEEQRMDEQRVEVQRMEEQRMEEHRMEEQLMEVQRMEVQHIEDDRPRGRIRIRQIKVLRRMIRKDDIGSLRSLFVWLSVLFFYILICCNCFNLLNELVMNDVL